jgi:hypothetical protein
MWQKRKERTTEWESVKKKRKNGRSVSVQCEIRGDRQTHKTAR